LNHPENHLKDSFLTTPTEQVLHLLVQHNRHIWKRNMKGVRSL